MAIAYLTPCRGKGGCGGHGCRCLRQSCSPRPSQNSLMRSHSSVELVLHCFEMTELELRTVDVSGVGRHSRRVVMDGDGNVCGDKCGAEGGPLRQPLMSGGGCCCGCCGHGSGGRRGGIIHWLFALGSG